MERRNNILLKVLLWPFIYIGMLFCLGNHSIYAKETCRIETASYILQASGFDEIFVMNKQSEKLVRLGSMRLGWSPAIVPEACTYEMVKEDGCQAIRAHFTFPERDDSGRKIPETLVLTGTYIARPSAVDVHYTVSGMPEGYVEKKWGGSQFRFVLLGERSLELPVAKTGLWQRHSEGGLPIEEFDAKFVPFRNGNYKICLAYNKGNSANLNWKDEGFRHTVFTEKSLQGEKVLDTRFSVVIASADESYEVISSRWHGRPFALTLTTDKTYNWWEDALETLEVNVNVTNTAQEKKNFRLNYWVRDFKGNVVVRQSEALVLASGECVVRPVRFRSEQERDLFFVEASLVDNEGREQVFSRTNICVLPPHKFFSSPEKSIMGLSAYWEIPDLDNLSRLLQRMGVKWLRNGDTANFPSIWAMFHNNVNWKKEWDEQMRKRTVRACLEKMVCNGNRIWEFGNEINMDNAGIAVSKDGIGGAVLLEPYVAWLKTIRRVQQEKPEWQAIKLISFGMAGWDEIFMNKLVEVGGWDLLDGIALHPGRGNYTPDYPVVTPWKKYQKPVKGYPYWNYYASIRLANDFIKKHGGNKELYLTEVYALDYPNHSWNDTPRGSAENVVLSYVLAAAEGVKNALYYQLFNSVWFDQLGVNAGNREYFFGLINRDLSFKPSLMAYCTIAEALDGATCKGWIKFPDENSHHRGLLFDTPSGAIAVLWNRAEGFIQKHNALSPEPWVDTWRVHTELELPAAGESLKLVNVIGQKIRLRAPDHKATISLTGAPVIVYGIDTARLNLYTVD